MKLLIDSIHHLTLRQRLQVYQKKQVVILTTHWPRDLEYFFIKKEVKRIRFKGLSLESLKKILEKRLKYAIKDSNESISLNETALKKLLKTYKDDHRGIINFLFDQFQYICQN